MKELVRRYLPKSLQSGLRRTYYRSSLLRRIYHLPGDIAARLSRKPEGLRPPPSLITVGDGPFEEIGREFLGYFIGIGRLRPDERVLEIGCGIGRMAIPLTTYLSEAGSYDGVDIARREVEWCQKNITPHFANFRFQHINVFNNQTNPKGRLRACAYRFPLADGGYDFIFLTSVFTHMLVDDIENYLKEIARLLREGGRLLATFFLLNDETRARLKETGSRFRHTFGSALVIDPRMPEASIAHEETTIRALFQKYGLRIEEPIRWGVWSGRRDFLSGQDLIVSIKKLNSP